MHTRYFPTGSMIIRPKGLDNVEIGIYGNDPYGRNNAIGYRGKKTNPDFRFRFQSEEQREAYIKKYIEDCKELEKVRAVRKESRKTASTLTENPVKVGDIFYTSWGYDQTNVEFFKVSEVKGSFVILYEMKAERNENAFMSGNTWPTNVPIGQPIRRKVLTYNGGTSVSLKIDSTRYAYPWDGRPKSYSSYA